MSRAYAVGTDKSHWIIPTAMQLVPAVLLGTLVPFTVESPRWLISKGRNEEAQHSLNRLRPNIETENGATTAEIEIMKRMYLESRAREEGAWIDLFRGNYLRRTWIATSLFIFEQTNGNQFIQSYGATFYVQQGLGAMSFTYQTVGQVLGFIGCVVGIFIMDYIGRRAAFIGGSAITALLLFIAAGLGLQEKPLNQASTNATIACFVILPATTRLSASQCAFLTGAEIGGVRMRKKIMAFGTGMDVAAA